MKNLVIDLRELQPYRQKDDQILQKNQAEHAFER